MLRRFRFLYASFLTGIGLLSVSCVSIDTVDTLGSPEPALREKSAADTQLHLISWNVHKGMHRAFTRDVEKLLDAIPEGNDVTLCLQEARSNTFGEIEDLHGEPFSGYYASSWRFPFARRSTGVLTIGNQLYPNSGVLRIPAPRRELYVASSKVSLRSEITLDDGRQLQIINCHGLNFVRISAFRAQLEEIFGSLGHAGSPAIVCGDFNAWSRQRLDLLDKMAAEAGLAEANPRGDDHSPAPKWLGWMYRLNGFDAKIRLDRIYTRGIKVTDCYAQTDVESSDHLPIVMTYRVLPAK